MIEAGPKCSAHPLTDQVVREIVERLRPQALWLFGSQVGRTELGPGDIDLAILSWPPLDGIEAARARTDLEGLLGRDVDLVALDASEAIVAMEVLRSGVLLHVGDAEALERFAMRVPSEYEDLKRLRSGAEQDLIQRWSGAD